MARVFDYKFIIILGLSLVVYFLYRELEALQLKVAAIEIPLSYNNDGTIEEFSNESNKLVPQVKANDETSPSNDIYSHDNLNTNTNENDPMMVNSIENLVVPEVTQLQPTEPTELTEPVEPSRPREEEKIINRLCKQKLLELQENAKNLNISLYNSTGNKLKKIELAQKIFNENRNALLLEFKQNNNEQLSE